MEGRAGSVSPSCRRGRKKLKIPFSFFPQGRQQREYVRNKGKNKSFSLFTNSFPCLRLFFPSLDFFSSVFLHKNESRQLCYPCRLRHIVWLGRGIEILPVLEKHKSAIASRREKVIKLLIMRSKKHPETEYERRRL